MPPAPAGKAVRLAGRRVWRGLAGLVLALLAGDQVVQHALIREGSFSGRRVAPFDPPLFCAEQVASLARVCDGQGKGATTTSFDPDLGWCHRPDTSVGEDRYDWAGARIGVAPLAREKRAGLRRIVAVGESFTHGDEVRAAETWSAQVDRARDDLEIANLGVGGYGPDQALLRLERDGFALAPDEVWLGLVPGTAIRATTLYLPALRHWFDSVAFKPRFRLDPDGALELVRNPAPTPAALCELLTSQARFLAALRGRDMWIDRASEAYGAYGTRWWHHAGLARLWITWSERDGRAPAPWFEDPESEPRRLVRAIVLRARDACRARGVRFRLVLLPESGDLQFRRETGREYWGPLLDELRRAGVEVLDVTPALAGQGIDATLWAPLGHYSAAGNRVVAESVLAALDP